MRTRQIRGASFKDDPFLSQEQCLIARDQTNRTRPQCCPKLKSRRRALASSGRSSRSGYSQVSFTHCGGFACSGLLKDWQVPDVFPVDLHAIVGEERRPPYAIFIAFIHASFFVVPVASPRIARLQIFQATRVRLPLLLLACGASQLPVVLHRTETERDNSAHGPPWDRGMECRYIRVQEVRSAVPAVPACCLIRTRKLQYIILRLPIEAVLSVWCGTRRMFRRITSPAYNSCMW